MAAKSLPDRPHLEQYRKQAKDLLRGLTCAEPQALERVRSSHPTLGFKPGSDELERAPRLADAQLVLAREHGFASWPKLVAIIRRLTVNGRSRFSACISCDAGPLALEALGWASARGVILFALAGAVGRRHHGVRQIADRLAEAGICVVLADLLTERETIEDAISEDLPFDLGLLKHRVSLVVDWIAREPSLSELPLGLYGSGTGGAAAIVLTSERPGPVRAIVCAAGRPDLAGPWVSRLQAPTLFAVGAEDSVGRGFIRPVLDAFPRKVASRLALVEGAGLRFEEGPVAAQVAQLAISWFEEHLLSPGSAPSQN